MRRRWLYAFVTVAVVASLILVAVALSPTILMWEKTFEVKGPKVECEIEIEDPKVVGYPVEIWVSLETEDEIESLNGTLTVNLYWYNESEEEWEHLLTLQEEMNVTLTLEEQTWTYTFTPEHIGQYKVTVTFIVETESQTFSIED